ncbi:MAG: hypothetical protein NTY28_14000 [Janthinobacterium sp.]|nr:hypothetical protein [Janthinobacterium sp.]
MLATKYLKSSIIHAIALSRQGAGSVVISLIFKTYFLYKPEERWHISWVANSTPVRLETRKKTEETKCIKQNSRWPCWLRLSWQVAVAPAAAIKL